MEIKETTQKNRIIARFMGWKDSPYANLPNKVYRENFKRGISLDQLNYHSSWELLMSVVEKIELTNRYEEHYPDMVTIWKNCCVISDGNNGYQLITIYAKTKIEAIYEACFEYIFDVVPIKV